MLQVKPGVFVGRLTRQVRDRIWQRACTRTASGSAVMIESVDSEQGYAVRLWGVPAYIAEDYEGLLLVREKRS